MNMSSVLDILMVDDDEFIQLIQTKIIQACGHNVFIADSGEQAIVMLQKFHFDLVLMDLNMLEMNGLQTTGRLRELGIQVPIYALTGDNDSQLQHQCLQNGFNGFFAKPLKPEYLKQALVDLEKLGK